VDLAGQRDGVPARGDGPEQRAMHTSTSWRQQGGARRYAGTWVRSVRARRWA
jgi:hypothetical protein